MGPILLKQERGEAVQTVNGRLEFIEKEIKRLEQQIQEGQGKTEQKKTEIYKLQMTMQQQQAAPSN